MLLFLFNELSFYSQRSSFMIVCDFDEQPDPGPVGGPRERHFPPSSMGHESIDGHQRSILHRLYQ